MPVKMLTPFLAAAAVGVAACGDDDKTTETTSSGGGAQQTERVRARAELLETRAGLETARTSYESGDKNGADELVSESYLQHFEKVEGPLEEVDEELTEELEEEIRDKLRADIKTGTKDAVLARFDEIFEHMKAAEAALR